MKKNLLKRDGVQSLIASLLCVVLGLLILVVFLYMKNKSRIPCKDTGSLKCRR